MSNVFTGRMQTRWVAGLVHFLHKVLKHYQLQAINAQNTPFITGYVFINPNTGNKFTDIRQPWKRMLKDANLAYTTRHHIRHILGTYLVNELGLSLEHVSYVLGHSDTKITQRYVNIKPQVAKTAIDALFNDFKTKEERYVENLNQAIGMGECIQAVLFPSEKLNEVGSNNA